MTDTSEAPLTEPTLSCRRCGEPMYVANPWRECSAAAGQPSTLCEPVPHASHRLPVGSAACAVCHLDAGHPDALLPCPGRDARPPPPAITSRAGAPLIPGARMAKARKPGTSQKARKGAETAPAKRDLPMPARDDDDAPVGRRRAGKQASRGMPHRQRGHR